MSGEETLEHALAGTAKAGIQADRKRLREDMCMQFSNPLEYVRELVANACDAGARRVDVSGRQDADGFTVIVEDDGCGMDKQAVRDYLMLFRSHERAGQQGRIGRHGIGKLSIAAVKGQCGFTMITSTGRECWRLTAGCLLEDTPIRLERLAEQRPPGTRLEIAFASGATIGEELKRIAAVLREYCRFMPIDILVHHPKNEAGGQPGRCELIRDEWGPQIERFGRRYVFEDEDGHRFDILLSLEAGGHELYQSHVLLSKNYSLFSRDQGPLLTVPHVCVRVESTAFEVPFGRHRLMNEEILNPLSWHLRNKVLPTYVSALCDLHEQGVLADHGVSPLVVEEIVAALLAYDPTPHVWSRLRLFSVRNRPRMSFDAIREAVAKHGRLFIEDAASPGIDYTAFEVPVLAARQAAGALDLLRKQFPNALVDLSLTDVVLEAPTSSSPPLGASERLLQRSLRFHPDAVRRSVRSAQAKHDAGAGGFSMSTLTPERVARLAGISDEARLALADLERLTWRVGYLVERGGTTPSLTHRFLLKGQTVVVNLHHPEVAQLVALAARAPSLAGHWGLAICVTDTHRVLAHLTPDTCEDLVLADAMAKCGALPPDDDEADAWQGGEDDPTWWDFRRDIEDEGFGL